jgi:hypothetical protein
LRAEVLDETIICPMRVTSLTHRILFDFKTIFIGNLKNNIDYAIKFPIIEFVKLATIYSTEAQPLVSERDSP